MKLLSKLLSTLTLTLAAHVAMADAAPALDDANTFDQKNSRLPKENIIEVLREQGQFKTLLSALDLAKLTSTIETKDDLGFFAPTDDAFRKLPNDVFQRIIGDITALTNVLKYHVLGVQVTFNFVPWVCKVACDLGDYETLNGKKLSARYDGTSIFVNGDEAKVLDWDLRANNGRIYSIDSVLIPK